ncbi:hypothetical protein HNY73_002385 [Argiope bruennichi]|uniref:Uncharacterized protein n=1 Tax=Argiope bruennichi TaxID=94029 RepID=A0A8T0FW01_ARGBR|nr:hypothetical protein HNY73_002385 [Argiope bruennichi]
MMEKKAKNSHRPFRRRLLFSIKQRNFHEIDKSRGVSHRRQMTQPQLQKSPFLIEILLRPTKKRGKKKSRHDNGIENTIQGLQQAIMCVSDRPLSDIEERIHCGNCDAELDRLNGFKLVMTACLLLEKNASMGDAIDSFVHTIEE